MADSSPLDPTPDLTGALRGLGAGGETPPELVAALVAELRAVAAGYLRGQRPDHTLQPTALVNEVFLRLFGSRSVEAIRDRQHFFALAARAMRQILVDHARQRTAARRGGGRAPVTLDDGPGARRASDEDILDVDTALAELSELDERQARVVELRFFAGLEMEEVAAALEISLSTAEREWRAARAWLGRRMADRRPPGAGAG